MDADRKNVTWEHLYKNLYTEDKWSFWGLLDFDKHDDGIIGWKEEITWNQNNKIFKEFKEKHPDFKISGDADFGMKSKVYSTYIENPKEKMHMFPNFSLMPRTGGMNLKKGGFGYQDRFDVFVYHLSQYYKIKDEKDKYDYIKRILWHNSQKHETTINPLYDFLNLFNEKENDYFHKMYFIEDYFVEKLIDSGEKTLCKGFDCERHCKLALHYWKLKKEVMKSIPNIEEYVDKDIDDDKYK